MTTTAHFSELWLDRPAPITMKNNETAALMRFSAARWFVLYWDAP
jgi:hypothetical protein